MAVKDSEEATLCCGVTGYHIAIIMEYSYGKLNMLQYMREFIPYGWTWIDTPNNQVHDYYVVAVKKQLSIFHNIFYVIFFVSPKRKALLWSYNLKDILHPYQYYCSVQ